MSVRGAGGARFLFLFLFISLSFSLCSLYSLSLSLSPYSLLTIDDRAHEAKEDEGPVRRGVEAGFSGGVFESRK